MTRIAYPSDLSDTEWELIEELFPPPSPIGRPVEIALREVVNAIFYWCDNGIKWRALPHDFPCWSTVYDYFRRWVKTGLWEQINQQLVGKVRQAQGRKASPTLVIIDSQSVEGTSKGGAERGVDGFKKVKGRKRHAVTDVLGLVLNCFVGAANQADVKAAPAALVPVLDTYETIEKILADQGYPGGIAEQLKAAYGCIFELTKKLGDGFVVQPWRWVVERTFSWLENARRLCRDYEEIPENHEAVVYIAMIRLMLRRLTDNRRKRKQKLA